MTTGSAILGLLTSTLFTLLALPSFYAWVGKPMAEDGVESP